MKLVIASLVTLAFSVALACPNLAGHYDCQGQATMTIRHSGNEYFISTTDSQGTYDEHVIADGQVRQGAPSSDYKSATQIAKCDASTLNVVTEITGNADEVYNQNLSASKLDSDLKLDIVMTLTQDGQIQEQKGTVLCSPK